MQAINLNFLNADDTTLSGTVGNFEHNNNANTDENINAEISKISLWLKLNKLSLNISKTKCVLFYQPRQKYHS